MNYNQRSLIIRLLTYFCCDVASDVAIAVVVAVINPNRIVAPSLF